MTDLPITPYLDEICRSLFSSPSHFLVLTAETAAGKSTMVPLALLPQVSGKILMLEPRRIATVAIADRISALLGEKTGGTVGYRLHLDSKISNHTRIEVITEAILTRRMQSDPDLTGISVVILDEFHERSIHADLALTFLREIMPLRNEKRSNESSQRQNDLFVIVMSATIDTERIATFLSAPVFSVPGRTWPVEIQYATDIALRNDRSVAEKAARAVRAELERETQSGPDTILVFLPGIAEIRECRNALLGILSGQDDLNSDMVEVLILHSSVPFEEQRRVLCEAQNHRRVVLSSAIAETGLTVPGVHVVIDSGLSRTARYDPSTGMSHLVTGYESVFSATQRAGRAGRTGPGRCVRLWAEHDVRLTESPPEILITDLTPLVLECALWGSTAKTGLDWLDSPPSVLWDAAQELLMQLGAIDAENRITGRGRLMASLGVHPRIAAVALAGAPELAARYAGFSENPQEQRRFLHDLERRIWSSRSQSRRPETQLSEAEQYSTNPEPAIPNKPVLALLAGFPDRIARHTGDGIYQFPSGRLASLPPAIRRSTNRYPLWIVAPEADAGEREGRVYAYEEIPEEEAATWLSERVVTKSDISYVDTKNSNTGKIRKTEYRMYGKLVLSERPVEAGAADIARVFCEFVRKEGVRILPWSRTSESFLARARFYYKKTQGIMVDDESLLDTIEDWLVPFLPLDGRLTENLLTDALHYRFDAAAIERLVPIRIHLANGITRPLAYEELIPGEGPVPVLEARVQDLFGCPVTPVVMGEPVLLRLLSPARRPLQITRDLAGFWAHTWADVRKEMQGRYPKHKWPINPLAGN